jgi:hypothetical protein
MGDAKGGARKLPSEKPAKASIQPIFKMIYWMGLSAL